jgi:DNA polymerase-3 subunit delta
MRLVGQRIEAFLEKPNPAVIAVLLYGPDQGLVRERADRLVASAAGDAADPFRVAELAADALKDDPVRLADEAAALPFSGGRRVVRIRDGKDPLANAVRNLLEVGTGGGLVVVEAGELGPRSLLRQVFESASAAAALPCYVDEGDTLRRVIADDLAAHGLLVTPEAADLLAGHLGADRGVTRRELEKLALYKGEPGQVEVDDVRAVVGDAGAVSLDAIAFAACGGDLPALDRALNSASAEGLHAIPLLRTVARHFQRLLQAHAVVAKGGTAKQAMDALRPAVFFRLQPQFRRQMHLWRGARLADGLVLLTETELECKRTGAPQELLCQRALFRLAELARSAEAAYDHSAPA